MGKIKRRQRTNKRKRILIANAFLAVFLFLGVGYSYLSANLDIIGDVLIKKRVVTAENLSYDNSNTGINCSTAQCMIDCLADETKCP